MDRPEPASSGGMTSFLEHYGIKGMKWGVRRSRTELARVVNQDGTDTPVVRNTKTGKTTKLSEEAFAKKKTELQIKKQGIDSLTNKEINDYVTRLDLEKRYSSAVSKAPQKGAGPYVKKLLVDIGQNEVQRVAKAAVAIQVEKALIGKGRSDIAKRIVPKKK